LEGMLQGPWTEELRRLCGKFLSLGLPIAIDLSQLRFLDRTGAGLLARLRRDNPAVRLCGGSPFVAALTEALDLEIASKA